MRITHWIIPIAAGAAILSPLAAQDMAEPATTTEMTAGQIAEMDDWPTEKQAEFGKWPPEIQAYYWSLPAERQALFWRLGPGDRASLAAMDEDARAAAWTMIEEKLNAMSSASPPGETDGS